MKSSLKSILCCLLVVSFSVSTQLVQAQDLSFFFSAGDFSGEPDRFGNTHTVGPASAIDPRPFGNEALADVFFDEDGLWLIYQVEGNIFLVSHAPGFFEDAPELTMEITPALPGRYEVILHFLDANADPGTGPIQAALNDGDLQLYFEGDGISVRATGGTTPGYPQFGGVTAGGMWWQTASLGEVEVEAGGTVRVRVDDVPGDLFNILADASVTTTFNGVSLRVIELGGAISEIQVNPAATDWSTDISGNQFKTGPVDESLSLAQWLTIAANVNNDNLWNTRNGLGPYGPIVESFPTNGDNAPPIKTSVIFAQGGTYDVFFSLGDTGVASDADNITNPNPLAFGFAANSLTTYYAGNGEFKGTPGYNDYEISVGQISVAAGEQVDFFIDDVTADPGGIGRSVYLGMRFVLKPQVAFTEFQVSPGVFDENFVDLFGNKFFTWPQDAAAYPNIGDWLTQAANGETRQDGSNKWHTRNGLGPYGPILESFPNSGNNAPALRTSVTFSQGGTYNVILNIGDTAAANFDQNLTEQIPLNFAFEGDELKRWHPNDGVFAGTPGYNDYEMAVGQITVTAGETRNFIIDDVQDGTAPRSVYLGMRFELVEGSGGPSDVSSWSLY